MKICRRVKIGQLFVNFEKVFSCRKYNENLMIRFFKWFTWNYIFNSSISFRIFQPFPKIRRMLKICVFIYLKLLRVLLLPSQFLQPVFRINLAGIYSFKVNSVSWKHQTNLWNMLKANYKDSKTTLIMALTFNHPTVKFS